MPITIINDDGGVIGTKILNDEGVDICPSLVVESIKIDFPGANSIVKAVITIGLVKTQTKANITQWVTKDPVDNKYKSVKSILFDDGNSITFDENGNISLHKYDEIVRFPDVSSGRTHKFRNVDS